MSAIPFDRRLAGLVAALLLALGIAAGPAQVASDASAGGAIAQTHA